MRSLFGFLRIELVLVGCLLLSGCGAGGNLSSSRDARKAALPRTASDPGGSDEQPAESRTEEYDDIVENDFLTALTHPQSTFSIDVDTASYSNVRRLINEGIRPPRGAVRIEEFINYFRYDYPQPVDDHPFSVSTDIAPCPWAPQHQLVRIGLKGLDFQDHERPASNLVFLIDVSGSMNDSRKLPLVKSAFRLLLEQLDDRDSVAIVVYAGASGVALNPTSAANRSRILNALDQLEAGGSTNGGEGIQLAYQLAGERFIEEGINRVILCTDGDFNVGITNRSDLVDLIQEKAKANIFLSVLGFGTGNYKDATMEKLADKGNGNYAYIDTLLEARKTLVSQMNATLVTIAKDVKIQVDFNPQRVEAYRLIGYENRLLKNEDFEDDTKDAGEIGAGHSVTALYEIVPVGAESPVAPTRESEFVETKVRTDVDPDTVLKVALRYKLPEAARSTEFETFLTLPTEADLPTASGDFQFASAVASFAMQLRNSKYSGTANLDWVLETAKANLGEDPHGFRSEFLQLVKKAKLMGQ